MRYFKPTDTTDIYFNQSLFIGDFSFCLVSPASGDCPGCGERIEAAKLSIAAVCDVMFLMLCDVV